MGKIVYISICGDALSEMYSQSLFLIVNILYLPPSVVPVFHPEVECSKKVRLFNFDKSGLAVGWRDNDPPQRSGVE
jgi:hypothetical protein